MHGKPLAVLDKSFLQAVTELPREQGDGLWHELRERFVPLIPKKLLEEALAAYALSKPERKAAHKKVLDAATHCLPFWMDHALELVFKQLILRQEPLDPWMRSGECEQFRSLVADVEAGSRETAKWMEERRKEKEERVSSRVQQQEDLEKESSDRSRNPQDVSGFLVRGIHYLQRLMGSAESRAAFLEGCLGGTMKRWHPQQCQRIDEALAAITLDLLEQAKFTRNYLLLEVFYDIAPVCRIGPLSARAANPFVLKRSKKFQINNEDDQQYVASAFCCRALLTCDHGMDRMAGAFVAPGLWAGKSILCTRNSGILNVPGLQGGAVPQASATGI